LGAGFLSLTLVLDKSVGWRMSVLIVCRLGVICAILIIAIKEPAKSGNIKYRKESTEISYPIANSEEKMGLKEKLKIIFFDKTY